MHTETYLRFGAGAANLQLGLLGLFLGSTPEAVPGHCNEGLLHTSPAAMNARLTTRAGRTNLVYQYLPNDEPYLDEVDCRI